jgi:hypothetical protein
VSREAKRAFVSLKKHTQKSSSCKGIQRLEESKGIGHWALGSTQWCEGNMSFFHLLFS